MSDPVVLPLDFSQPCVDALSYARRLADDEADLRVVHVLPPLEPNAPGVVWGEVDEEGRRARAVAHVQAWLVAHHAPDAVPVVDVGDPGTCIARLAQAVGAAFIVIPSHGRRGLRRLFLGSVAERVVRLAPCPVLVLREPPTSVVDEIEKAWEMTHPDG